MKITKKQLRQIIEEEVSILSERNPDVKPGKHQVTSAEQLLNPYPNQPAYSGRDAKLLIDWMKSQDWQVRVNPDGTISVFTPGYAFYIYSALI